MIAKAKLNKKQLIVTWIMILSVLVVIICTIFALPINPYVNTRNPHLTIRIFLYWYFFIFIFGFLLTYTLRDKNKEERDK